MNSIIQEYLRSGGKPQDLTSNFGIRVIGSAKYPSLIQFKYDQIESPSGHPMVRNARGLILDSQDNWNVIAWPFNRFYNYGDGNADEIDWDSAIVQEKVDGSIQILFYYDNKWNVATSGTIDANLEINGFQITFTDLFWKTFQQMELIEPKGCNTHSTYIFELVSQYNKIVVQYAKPELIFIGQRDNQTGEENLIYDNEYFKHIAVRRFNLFDLESILKSLPDIPPTQQEGYVLMDKYFHRQKLKSPQYVALHHIKDSFSLRRATEIVRTSEIDEIVSYFPEYKELLESTKGKYDSLVSQIEMDYERLRGIPVQKDFALEAVKTICPAALFNLRAGKSTSAKHFLCDIHIQKVMQFLGLKDLEENN